MISVWIPASIRFTLGESALDRPLLADTLRDDPGLSDTGAPQLRPPLLHFLAELLHVPEHPRILVADALHHVEASEQIVEILRSEDDLDRAAPVTVDVERLQSFRNVHLRDTEAFLRNDEMARVRVEIGVDLPELHVRAGCTTRSPSRAPRPTG